MGWFNVLMTEFIVACVAGYYLSPIHNPFLLPPYPLPLSTQYYNITNITNTNNIFAISLPIVKGTS